ncbi:MAG: NAD kinase [Flavobacteriaceae bacterium]|nr:NAD kinase [Psychroflexus sp.]
MKVGIFGQSYYPQTQKYLQQLLGVLEKKEIHISFEKKYLALIKENKFIDPNSAYDDFETLDKTYDLFFSIGGDGTILTSASMVKDLEIPIIGINTGRLGFLATIHDDEIEHRIEEILKGNYTISKRSLMQIEASKDNEKLAPFNYALNELAINRRDTTSMITIEVWLNDEYLNAYWADGIVISTPTGSTGYSLSCGGPIITPQTNSFVISPIAPHNLNARPLVIPDETEIKLKISSREDSFLVSLDGRTMTMPNNIEMYINKADFEIGLATQKEDSFLTTLRKKLLWGEDKRN